MINTVRTKRVTVKLEFYLRGKTKIPSVNFIEGCRDEGIPFTSASCTEVQITAFSKFNKAAHEFCKQLADAKELA